MNPVKLILFTVSIFYSLTVFNQQSFELVESTQESEAFVYTFEDFSKNYISIGARNTEFGADSTSPIIAKYDASGNIIKIKELYKFDTTFSFKYGLQKKNGNYLILGTLSDIVTPKDNNVTYLCELSSILEIIWEKMYPIPTAYIHHALVDFLIGPDSNIIVYGKADSSQYSSDDLIYTALFSMDGEKLDFRFYNDWRDFGVYNEMIFKPDSSGFYIIGDINKNYQPKDWLEIDNNLNIVSFGNIENNLSYLHSPLSSKWLSDGNMIIANLSSGITVPSYQDLEVRIVDPQFNLVRDTIIYYPNEHVYIPVNKGLDFDDENLIWVATFEAEYLFLPGTEVFNFHIFDSNLNLKGVKQYGGDRRYWFYALMVTSDGGCLLTGMVPDNDGSYNLDAYIIKVMPEDILTLSEETLYAFDKDVLVFPNPFSTEINCQTVRKDLTFNLFDMAGKFILSEEIDPIPNFSTPTGFINAGFYFYIIENDGRIIQSGKLLKK